MRELRRVLGSRRLLAVLLLLLILNVALYVRQETRYQDYDPVDYSTRYQALVERCRGEEPEASLERVQAELSEASRVQDAYSLARMKEEMPDFYEIFVQTSQEEVRTMAETGNYPCSEAEASLQAAVCRQMISQLTYFIEYPQYLKQVKDNAEKMQQVSIFGDPNSFSYKNIQKTVKDFAGMDGAVLSLGEDQAVTSLFSDGLADYSIVLFQLLVCAMLLTERKKGLWGMVYATAGGRLSLALWRVAVLFCSAVLSCVLLLGGKMAAASWLYGGFGDPGRLIQSMELFRGVPVPTTLAAFFIQYLAVKIAGTFLLGLCLWLILSAVANIGLAFGAVALFLGMEYAFFTLVRDSYLIVPLRYANVFAFVEYLPIYSRYLNISVFGELISANALTLGLLPVLLLAVGGGSVAVQLLKKPVTARNRLEKLWDRVRRLVNPLTGRFGLWGREVYKIFWVQKGVLLLAALLYLLSDSYPPYYMQTGQEQLRNYYAGQMTGPVTRERLEQLEEELRQLDAEIEQVGSVISAKPEQALAYQQRLEELSDRRSAIQTLQGEGMILVALEETVGEPGWFLNDSVYQCLIHPQGESGRQERALTAMLFTVLLLAGFFAYENQQGVVFMVRACWKGRSGVFLRKTLLALGVTTLIWALVYGRELWLAVQYYGNFSALAAPIQSIELLRDFSVKISLGGFLVLYYGARILTLWTLCIAVLFVSCLCSRIDHAVVAQIGLWLLPAALALMGVDTIGSYTFLSPLSTASCFLEDKLWIYGLLAALWLICSGFLFRRWSRAK